MIAEVPSAACLTHVNRKSERPREIVGTRLALMPLLYREVNGSTRALAFRRSAVCAGTALVELD